MASVYIDREECIGDSLVKLNSNFFGLDADITNLRTLINTLSTNMAQIAKPYNFITTGTSLNAQTIKTSAGVLLDVITAPYFPPGGGNSYAAYIKFYDKASTPNPAVDVPFLVVSPSTQPYVIGAGGIQFNNGLSVIVVNGITNTDTTSAPANNFNITIGYN